MLTVAMRRFSVAMRRFSVVRQFTSSTNVARPAQSHVRLRACIRAASGWVGRLQAACVGFRGASRSPGRAGRWLVLLGVCSPRRVSGLPPSLGLSPPVFFAQEFPRNSCLNLPKSWEKFRVRSAGSLGLGAACTLGPSHLVSPPDTRDLAHQLREVGEYGI